MSRQPATHRALQCSKSIAAGAIALALVGAACSSSKSSSSPSVPSGTTAAAAATAAVAKPATGTPIEVGATQDLSATFSANGIGLSTGLGAAFDAVNKAGGVGGHPIHLTSLDDASKVDRGVANVTQLLTQTKVAAIGGLLLSNICLATQQAAAAAETPMLCNAGDPKQFGTSPNPNVFLPTSVAANENQGMFAVAKQLVGTKTKPKVAFIGLASASLEALKANQKATASSLGWELGPDITVPLTTTDLTAPAAQIAAAKPDVVFSGLADSTAILLDRGLQANGSSAPVVASDAVTKLAAITTKDPNLYYVSTVSNGGTPGAGYQTYLDAVKAAGADPTKPFVDRGYIQGLIIIAALKACNACTGQALIDSLNKLSLETDGFTAGHLAFSATDHQGIHKLFAYHYDSSKAGVALFAQDLPVGP